MENFTHDTGFTSSTSSCRLWRPWTEAEDQSAVCKVYFLAFDLSDIKHLKPQVTHPVKLYWPKSKCFDYLYQDAEMLLRNYPVQATICPYEESSSDEESEEEEEELTEKDN
ncbi:protein ripply2 [Sphaeramia orbicularis]|uniref:protein ripply2 n=1 Tax=Sphaeramia orbicularis TaxID=375764 RepID=UPI00118077FF|nr:protein ripply2-like [Sphaeramia orbicularis]